MQTFGPKASSGAILKALLTLACLLVLALDLDAQRLLWHKIYPYSFANGTPRDMLILADGQVHTINTSLPILVDSANNNVQSFSLNRFSKYGDSLSFTLQSPGIVEEYISIDQLSNKNIAVVGSMYQRPFYFGANYLNYLFVRIFDSTATQIKRDIPFYFSPSTTNLGNLGGILPTTTGGFWIYGTRDDTTYNNNYRPYLYLFDSAGHPVYEREYADSGFGGVFSMIKHPNGNLVMFGTRLIRTIRGTRYYNVGKCFVMELDTLGNLKRRRYFNLDNRPGSTFTVDGSFFPKLFGAIHPDGSYLLYGNVRFSPDIDSTGFITKIDSTLTTTHWLRRMDPLFKLRLLADGSSFIAGYVSSRIRGRYMYLRRYDNNGSLFQDFRLSGAQGTLPSGPYAFHSGNYEFAGDSSVIFVGDVTDHPYTNVLPYLFIAKIGGYPNPYNPLALPLDRRMMEETYVYPNPFQDQFTLATKSGATEAGQLYLFNLLGQQVYQSPYTTGEPMHTPPIKPGIYLWRFVGKGVYSGRLVWE